MSNGCFVASISAPWATGVGPVCRRMSSPKPAARRLSREREA